MARPGLRDRADRSPEDIFFAQGGIWGSPVLPPTALSHFIVNEVRLPCLRNPAFSAVDCMRLQSALGWLGPDGVPSHTTDPFVGNQLRFVACLPPGPGPGIPGKIGISLTRWFPGTSRLEASWCQKCDLPWAAVGFAVDGQDLAMGVGGGVHPALEEVTGGGGRTMRSLLYR